jgi:signal transduction histidine kinase
VDYFVQTMPDAPDPHRSQADAVLIESLRKELARERSQGEVRSRIFRLLSHEFRTPLTIILSSTELLQVYGEKWPQEKRAVHLGKIVNAVGLLSSQLDDVLLFNKMQADAVVASQSEEPWSMAKALADLLQESEIEIQRDRLEVVCQESIELRLDRRLMLQVLRNLVHNALRYTAGKVVLEMDIGTPDCLRASVRDEGDGFSATEQEHLFEPFFRGQTAQGKPGTGLGLAIVRECVRILGGEIRYEAMEPRGSRFVLEFVEYA